uniref:DUF1360 domain-containing protein n=1 Tax=Mycobacterium riyadhense TaxID=486698 RepID=A0A653EQ83_9MYCO|nr:hypothetical protein BIN_B_03101 [Mycobacterium riyadhense]
MAYTCRVLRAHAATLAVDCLPPNGYPGTALGEMLTCPFCLDMWVATMFAIGLIYAPRLTRPIAGTFTALAGADFLHLGYAMAQRSAQG